MGPEINREQVASQFMLTERIACHRHSLGNARQLGDLLIGKTLNVVGRERYCVPTAMRSGNWQGKVIAATLGLQVVKDRKIQLAVGGVDPAPYRFAALDDPQYRIMLIGHHIADLVLDEGLDCLSRVTPPGKGSSEKLGMEHTTMQRKPGKGNACRK